MAQRLVTALTIGAWIWLAAASSAADVLGKGAKGKRNPQETFDSLDANHDGKLQPSEFAQFFTRQAGNKGKNKDKGEADRTFTKLDRNHDGFITLEVFKEWLREFREERRKGGKPADAATKAATRGPADRLAGDPAQVFQRLDTNKDGKLTLGEFAALWEGLEGRQEAEGIFPKLDKEHSGGITLEIFKAWLEDYRKQAPRDPSTTTEKRQRP